MIFADDGCTCAALIQQKDSLIDQIERDRANWRNEKRFLVEQRAQEEVKVEEHRARRVADWEREKEQVLAVNITWIFCLQSCVHDI